MRKCFIALTLIVLLGASRGLALGGQDGHGESNGRRGHDDAAATIQLGPRPFFLVNDMTDSALKRELLECTDGPFRKSDFSIGHRGAALQFPEHTRESYEAAARMGAGIVECDVTFTKDLQLVCRHSQADLHTTTNILVTPLASKCTQPFTPAVLGPGGAVVVPASAECRTSDITLAEFKTLRGKMDAFNPAAQTPAEFLGGVASFRTDLYAGPSSGHLLSHRESIALFKKLGVKMTPELKAPSVSMPFNGFTQAAYAQKMINEYKAAGVDPSASSRSRSTRTTSCIGLLTNRPSAGRRFTWMTPKRPRIFPALRSCPATSRRASTLSAPRSLRC